MINAKFSTSALSGFVLLLVGIIDDRCFVFTTNKSQFINHQSDDYIKSYNRTVFCNISERSESEHVADQNWCNTLRSKPICWNQSSCTGTWPGFLFRPEINNWLFLEAKPQKAGLGHSIFSLNGLIQVAIRLRLTLRVNLRTAGSGHSISREFANSLFEDYFFAALPAECRKPHIIRIKFKKLPAEVSRIRNESNPGNLCYIFLMMDTGYALTEQGFNPCGVREALRIRLPRPTNLRCLAAPAAPRRPAAAAAIRIAIHIRRGDVVRRRDRGTMLRVVATRGVPNQCAEGLLLQVLAHLRARSASPLEVTVHAEGSRSIHAVVDLDGSLSDLGRSSPHGEARRLGPARAEEAVADACGSHVLVTGRSGFSHLLAVFCESTAVVAVPMWSSYAYLRNAVVASETPGGHVMRIAGAELAFPTYSLDPEAFDSLLRSFGVVGAAPAASLPG